MHEWPVPMSPGDAASDKFSITPKIPAPTCNIGQSRPSGTVALSKQLRVTGHYATRLRIPY